MPRFLPETEIQEIAQDVLKSFEEKRGVIRDFVPLDDIAEQHLGIHFDVFDNALLPAQFHGTVLGYIDLQSNSIGIHESILPENGGSEGRYHFTLGHEVGHFMLHREEILASAAQFNCFEQEPTRYMAKTEQSISSAEWQADCFSSYFIMPDRLVSQHWKNKTGNYRPLALRDIAATFNIKSRGKYRPEVLAEIYCKDMAKQLKVSSRALYIRLKNMGLIVEHEQLRLMI